MSDTDKNLAAAFAGESQANRRYLAFARKAEAEGHTQVARLFRAAAAAETVHAHSHLKTMGGVKATADNLRAAVEGEHFEFTEMYPEFVNAAQTENATQAGISFDYANQVEQIHHRLFSEALAAVASGQKLHEADLFVCAICGNTIGGPLPDKCPICGTGRDRFMKID